MQYKLEFYEQIEAFSKHFDIISKKFPPMNADIPIGELARTKFKKITAIRLFTYWIPESKQYEILDSLSHYINYHQLDIQGTYFAVRSIYQGLDVLNKAEMYSKDFNRDIKTLKSKVDLISRLAGKSITVNIPYSKTQLKVIFYILLKKSTSDITDEALTDLYKLVFNEKVYKTNWENTQGTLIESVNKYLSSMKKGKKESNFQLQNFNEKYTGNPN